MFLLQNAPVCSDESRTLEVDDDGELKELFENSCIVGDWQVTHSKAWSSNICEIFRSITI